MPPAGYVRPPSAVGSPKYCYRYSPYALDHGHEHEHEHGPKVAMKH